jgi:hypothetical protein
MLPGPANVDWRGKAVMDANGNPLIVAPGLRPYSG